MRDNGYLGLPDLMRMTAGLVPNGHGAELEGCLRQAAVIPFFLQYRRIDTARTYLGNARRYKDFTSQPIPGIDGYLDELEREIESFGQQHIPEVNAHPSS